MRRTRVAIILIGPGSIGGAERRVMSLTPYLADSDTQEFFLIINNELADSLATVGLRPACETAILRSWFKGAAWLRGRYLLPVSCVRLLGKLCTVSTHLFLSMQLALVLLHLRPKVIHLVLDSARLIFVPWLFLNRAALVVSLVGSEIRDFESIKALDRWVLVQCIHRAQLVDVLSEELRDLALRYRVAPSDKITIEGSFVETDKFRPSVEKRPWVVFAARLVEEKNPFLFLDAIVLVKDRLELNVQFFLLGTGPLEDTLKERIRDPELANCMYLGFQVDIGDILAHSLIFCSLQARENYPSRSLLEAMSCANAIIATDVGYTHRLVNQRTGVRVPPDPAAVAKAIIDLLSDVERTSELGRNARDLVLREFSPARYRAKMIKVYDEALLLAGYPSD